MSRKIKVPFPMETFLRRLGLLRLRHGIIKNTDFERRLGLQNTGRWGRESQGIDMDTVLYIAEYFDVSIDWLLGRAGHEDSQIKAAEAVLRYRAAPADVNEDLLGETIDMVLDALKRRQKKYTTRQQAFLIARIYTDCLESRTKPSILQIERNLLFFEAMTEA